MFDAQNLGRLWLLTSNFAMLMGWARVLKLFLHNSTALLAPVRGPSHICVSRLDPALRSALIASFLEFFNAMTGLTRSPPRHVLLFAVVRAGVELMVAPLLAPVCNGRWHLWTALCWSLGDTVRFLCFLLDTLLPGHTLARRVRYTVGPLLFPLGAAGEMAMVATLAYQRGWWALYVVAALWIVGFYPLFRGLLANRRKFMAQLKEKKTS